MVQNTPQKLASLSALDDAELIPAGADRDALDRVAEYFSIGITPDVLAAMAANDPSDPLYRQYVPDAAEARITPDESPDPTGDDPHTPVPGIVHRYPDRVLLKPTQACAVYCRFCFRKSRVGPGQDSLSPAELESAIAYIENTPRVREVILTGGDPLVLSPRRLSDLLTRLDAIAHLDVIRIHTRVPVADPGRVNADMLAALSAVRKPVYVSIHVNHPAELTDRAADCLTALHRAGMVLLSQSVLLKGVNDDAGILEKLFRRLVALRVRPYYLHHPDAAPGTSHFRLPVETGQAIMRSLRGRLTGIAQPAYVYDIPGGYGKVPVGPDWLDDQGRVRDPHGHWHTMPRT